MKRWIVLLFLLLLLFPGPREGFGEDPADKEQVYAIQNRVFHYCHEIGASCGYFPDDDFYHLYPLGLHYTYHINEHLGWEVARGYLMLNREKELRKDLEKKFGVAPTEFRETKYMVHTHLVVKPFYGKDAVWNRRILNHEGYLFLGGGMVSYENKPAAVIENVLSVSFGIGMKYFIRKHLCLNLEIRDLVNFREDKRENRLGFGLGLGFRFNLSPRKTERDETVKVLQNYLREDGKP
ncbi:MAG: outer membrane beta-barrel domain-containing protein [bacterium]